MSDSPDLSAGNPVPWLRSGLSDAWLAQRNLTVEEGLARHYDVPLRDAYSADLGERPGRWGGRLLCFYREESADWVVLPALTRILRGWDVEVDTRSLLVESRRRTLEVLVRDAQESTSLIAFADPETDGTDPVIVALVSIWWQFEHKRGLSAHDARFLLALSPSTALTQAADAAGVPEVA